MRPLPPVQDPDTTRGLVAVGERLKDLPYPRAGRRFQKSDAPIGKEFAKVCMGAKPRAAAVQGLRVVVGGMLERNPGPRPACAGSWPLSGVSPAGRAEAKRSSAARVRVRESRACHAILPDGCNGPVLFSYHTWGCGRKNKAAGRTKTAAPGSLNAGRPRGWISPSAAEGCRGGLRASRCTRWEVSPIGTLLPGNPGPGIRARAPEPSRPGGKPFRRRRAKTPRRPRGRPP